VGIRRGTSHVRLPGAPGRNLAGGAVREPARSAPIASRRLARERYYSTPRRLRRPGGAAPPGSGRTKSGCHAQGHHLHHWANGGSTQLENLTLLCGFHHRAVHEEGYQVERDTEGTLPFRPPRGWPIPEVPPAPPLPPNPMRAIVASNRANGHAIDAWT